MYVELHARSAFSFLRGAALPEELAQSCATLQMPAMALLDTDGVYGAPRFHLAAQKLGVKAHIGAELPLQIDAATPGRTARLPVLVKSRAGYQNLCRLITRMKMRVPKHAEPWVTGQELAEHAGGLVALTGDAEGPLAIALAQHGKVYARAMMERLREWFGQENIYVELQRHFLREEEARNRAAMEIAREFSLPLLAANGVCYAHPEQREILDVFTCIREHKNLFTAGRLLQMNSERYLKTPAQMEQLFSDLPHAIANTQELSSRLQFTLEDLGYEFPQYPVPAGESMNSFLRKRAEEGMRRRYQPVSERVRQQVERELALIEKLNLAGYFLIVWDIVRFCREQNILIQGRGSAANSAVCYSLGITAVDPIGMELLFERFLSEERGEWPDIDLDLPSGDQRERAIQYVYQRYGKFGAAMTANVITFRGRSAAREVGKAMGFDAESVDKLSKFVGSWEWKAPTDTMTNQFLHAGFDLRHSRIQKYLDLCLRMQDLPRHLGQHSGGMVICQGQLDAVVPLEPATMPGRVVVQWDKDDCADLGIVKVDLLGLGMMAVLEDSIQLIRENYKEEVDLAHLPQDEQAADVYETIRKADTVGMFQIESRAQMASLPRNGPARFYDLVVQVGLIRPGPIVGKMTNPYLRRRQGKEQVTYPHPTLEPVLKRTLGVPLFQEQLLKMAMICANFSGGEAEELRRALGSKRSEQKMKKIEQKLRSGMTQNGIGPLTQEAIVQFITAFALYGFPESHAASFALLAFASAFLKVRYLAAFTAALLNNQPMGFYAPSTIVKDAQRHGLKVRPVDVMKSGWLCTLENLGAGLFAMRLGLRYVRGMRQQTAQALVRERELGPFANMDELAQRVPELCRNELARLAEVGALNQLAASSQPETNRARRLHRRDALWHVERLSRPAGPLFERPFIPDLRSPLDAMTDEERLLADFDGTGLTVGPHPMQYRRKEMDAMRVVPASELCRLPSGKFVRIAGCVIVRQRPGTASGFIFLSLEDETGISNAIITPDLYDQNRLLIIHERFLLIEGILQNQDNVTSVKAASVSPLAITQAKTASHDFH